MNPKRFTMVCGACLVFAGIAAAQQEATPPAQSPIARGAGGGINGQSEPNTALYEDVEIMRRILARTAQALENGNASVRGHVDRYGFFRGQVPQGMVATPTAVPPRDTTTPNSGAMGGGSGGQGVTEIDSVPSGGTGPMTGYTLQPGPGQRASTVHAQGGYLKGYGVVYTLTLPPALWPNQRPASAPTRSNGATPSLWEEVRSELRGEAPKASQTVTREAPRTDDVLLRALFDNAGNFRLPEHENVALIATFSASAQTNQSAAPLTQGYVPPHAVMAAERLAAFAAADARNNELLGDLHLKQGRAEDAVKAYEKAVERGNPPMSLLTKLAEAYLGVHNVPAALESLKAAERAGQQAQTRAAAGQRALAPGVPATLTISVSWSTLAELTQKRLSFEEFKKLATIEYLHAPDAK